MPAEVFVLLKGFTGEQSFSQRLFVVEVMNAVVADSTDHDAFLELSPGKTFPSLFSAVKLPGYQVVAG